MSRRNAEGAPGGSGASTAAVFGEVLKHFREAALLTQEGLAREIPCDRSHVARVEAGTRVPQDTFAAQGRRPGSPRVCRLDRRGDGRVRAHS